MFAIRRASNLVDHARIELVAEQFATGHRSLKRIPAERLEYFVRNHERA